MSYGSSSFDPKNYSPSAIAYGPPWHIIIPVIIVLGSALTYGLGWALPKWRALNALESATIDLQKGFGALAADKLEPFREQLVLIEGGCPALLGAYYQTRNVLRLEWSAQACLSAGRESPDAYIGLAASREFMGRDAEAIPFLQQGIKRFENSGPLHYRLGLLYAKNKLTEQATTAFIRAAEYSPENAQLNLEVLQYLAAQRLWNEARPLAEKLRSVATDNAEIKLMLADVFRNLGDASATSLLKQEASEMLAKAPEKERLLLENKYHDVLHWQEASVPAAPVAPALQNTGTLPGFDASAAGANAGAKIKHKPTTNSKNK